MIVYGLSKFQKHDHAKLEKQSFFVKLRIPFSAGGNDLDAKASGHQFHLLGGETILH